MDRRTNQISTTQLIILFIVGVMVGGIILFAGNYVIQNGVPHFLNQNQDTRNMAVTAIDYQLMNRYVNNRISVDGDAIIANDTNNVCGSNGWSTCKLWFTDDPINHGLGLHEIKINTGQNPDSITQPGILFDHYGSRLNLIKTDQFSWYHVKIIGIVESCQVNKCLVDVDTIYGLQ